MYIFYQNRYHIFIKDLGPYDMYAFSAYNGNLSNQQEGVKKTSVRQKRRIKPA